MNNQMTNNPSTISKKLDFENLFEAHQALIIKTNNPSESNNGVYTRYEFPILTAAHAPLHWRYDLNTITNPLGLERIGVNATFNAGAIKWNKRYMLCVRVEGYDRKSFFAIAESPNGVDNFKFWEHPIILPETDSPDVNVYDMRLTQHEDGWVYGVFCTERKDPNARGDMSKAIANAGIARTKDLKKWERLPDLITPSNQQRNVVLHPEFIDGQYAFYTRPQDGFIEAGSGGGIGLGLTESIEKPIIKSEEVIYDKKFHTVYESKSGLGPAPFKTEKGWLHLAHGVRNTAAGLRYVLFMFITDLVEIQKVIYRPAGYFMAPNDQEIIGDVGNVVFSNGWIEDSDGTVFIYYASSDVRMHVAVSSVDRLLDYCMNTPQDTFTSKGSVETINQLIEHNKGLY